MGFCAFFSPWWIFPSQDTLNDNIGWYYRDMRLMKEKRLPGNMVVSIFVSERESDVE